MHMGTIYIIVNTINDRIYVGQTTKSVVKRWRAHVQAARDGKSQQAIHRAIRKHGEDAFAIGVLETTRDLDLREAFWIDSLGTLGRPHYNMKRGGHLPKYSDEARAKISASQKARLASPEGKEIHRVAMEKRASSESWTRAQATKKCPWASDTNRKTAKLKGWPRLMAWDMLDCGMSVSEVCGIFGMSKGSISFLKRQSRPAVV